MAPTPIWTPEGVRGTAVDAFRRYVNRRHRLNLTTYKDLHAWSVDDVPAFAEAVFNFAGMQTSTPPTSIVEGVDTMFPPPRWFPGAKMNYAENILAPGLALKPNAVAVTLCEEGSEQSEDFTFTQLAERSAVWANALSRMGVRVGDRVATVLPNRFDCLAILLGAAAIGAIFSSTSPDMGATGIVERYSQIHPTVFICDTTVKYGGKIMDLRDRFQEVNQTLRKLVPELKYTIVVNGPLFTGDNVRSASEALDLSQTQRSYEQLPFDHPIYILYSSGTTGTPKCITHAAGRALLQQKKELLLGSNMGPNSTLYQYTTTGWMMWNWAIAVLSLGSRLLLYDGSPLYPSPAAQLDLVRRQGVTHWGTSPKFLATLRKSASDIDLNISSLQQVQSAGSPLSAELHQWFTSVAPKGVGLFSGSGGTDLVGGIVGGSLMNSVYAGEIAGPSLGMKVEIWNHEGRNIEDTGETGDLVITRPFFSMPVGFWTEGGEAKYRAAYFEQFPGVWYHGDLIRKIPATGGYEILGRSDGVLNPGGVRFGSAEIYGVVDKFSSIQDCLCVGQKLPPDFRDEQVLLFLKMSPGERLDERLKTSLRRAIATSLSPRHVPAQLFQVNDIPYTVNGKRIENLVRDIVGGKSVGEARTAINPECLLEYRKFALSADRRSGSSRL